MPADRSIRVALFLIAAIAVLAALQIASSVITPVVCAIFIIALAWPLQKRLQDYLPQLLALAIVISVAVSIFVLFGSLVSWGFSSVGRSLIAEAGRFQSLYARAVEWLDGHGIAVAGMWAEHFNVRWAIGAMQSATARLNTTITFWLVVVVYLILGLLEVDVIRHKLLAMQDRTGARILLEGGTIIAAKFRRYMWIRTVMSLATGTMVWALAWVAGLQLAAEWGVIAFTLNYIPFIGPFIATMFPTLYALAQFESLQSALIVFACLNIIQFVIGSYIEPRVAGNALAMSPFIVLFSVFLWAYLWGIFGAFIGVPISIAVLTFCALHPASRWIADLFGAPDKADGGKTPA